jgi:hypothetical protein
VWGPCAGSAEGAPPLAQCVGLGDSLALGKIDQPARPGIYHDYILQRPVEHALLRQEALRMSIAQADGTEVSLYLHDSDQQPKQGSNCCG